MTNNSIDRICRLTHESSPPLYHQLATQLRDAIKEGTLKSGEILPTEIELTQSLQVSRTVIRRAFTILVEEGYLRRVAGKGTYVSSPKIEYGLLGFYNLQRTIEAQGRNFSIELNSVEYLPMDLTNAAIFRSSSSDPLLRVVRILKIDDSPTLLEIHQMPASVLEGVSVEELAKSRMLALLIKYGNNPKNAKRYIEPRLADPYEAAHLGVLAGSAVLLVDRYTYAEQSDNVIARCRWIVRGDKCRYYLDLNNMEEQ